jgi:two-component system sensor histidine kinase HydH
LRLVEKQATAQGVKIESEVVPQDLQLQGDRDLLIQALLNLYLNAIHAMAQGGTLEVRAWRDPLGVTLLVADSGAGIRAEDLPHIFDPYFTTKPRGVGLGLANVHKFIGAHGAQIEVQSRVEKGSKFLIRFYSKPYAQLKKPPMEAVQDAHSTNNHDSCSR